MKLIDCLLVSIKKKNSKRIWSLLYSRKRAYGAITLKRLLDYFGTFKAIESATFEEIC